MTTTTFERRIIKITGRRVVAFPTRDELAPPVRPLFDYWQDLCGGALPVPKAKIDPLALEPRLLSHILLVEALFDPPDFRYRLIGTEITGLVGRDSTGKLLSELRYPKGVGERIRQIFAGVVETGSALYAEDPADWASKDFMRMASLFLPATSDGKRTDLIFGAVMAARRAVC